MKEIKITHANAGPWMVKNNYHIGAIEIYSHDDLIAVVFGDPRKESTILRAQMIVEAPDMYHQLKGLGCLSQ